MIPHTFCGGNNDKFRVNTDQIKNEKCTRINPSKEEEFET